MGDDKKVKKLGMKDIQREGFEYELTVSLSIDRDTHAAVASKDRTELFEKKDPFIITEETCKLIAEWCEKGIDAEKLEKEKCERLQQDVQKALEVLGECQYKEEVLGLRDTLSEDVKSDSTFKAAANKRYQELSINQQ